MIRAFNHHRRLVSDPMTEAYREQPSDWWVVRIIAGVSTRLGFLLAGIVAGCIAHHAWWSAGL